MPAPEPLTFANGLLPISVLLLLVTGLPALLAGGTLSQLRLAAVVALTALTCWLVGAGIMAWAYFQANGLLVPGVAPYLWRSGLLALFWTPVLVLVWLMRAQGVERRRGLLMRDVGE